MTNKQAYAGLLERLVTPKSQQVYTNRDGTIRHDFRNPDGPEAAEAISSLLKRVGELEGALRSVLPPSHGVCGGPLVGAKCIYEDSTDENTARHRGWISHEAIAAARAALNSDAPLSIGEVDRG